MKIETVFDVHELIGAYVPSAVLGLALESDLFWRLAERPRTAAEVAGDMDIPTGRCRYWLDMLVDMNLLEVDGERYAPTETAHTAILSTHGREAWTNIAQELRESFPSVSNLPSTIHAPGSIWTGKDSDPPNYFEGLKKSPERARRFTRMLYEFHQSLADKLGDALNTDDVRRMMDLGGGSGVMSMALLKRNPRLRSTIVDIENVCQAGREIVTENSMADRIDYFAADFLRDDLPGGFDMILECDVCVYKGDLLRKLHESLNPNGRFVVVDQFAPEKGVVPPGRPTSWGFLRSLVVPDFTFPTALEVRERLEQAGFQLLSETAVSGGWLVIEAGARG
ncbi:MAG: methyltransferase [Proteobacteria bacterium]|nr:methyltransferase [Pseudomonadota bacterium]